MVTILRSLLSECSSITLALGLIKPVTVNTSQMLAVNQLFICLPWNSSRKHYRTPLFSTLISERFSQHFHLWFQWNSHLPMCKSFRDACIGVLSASLLGTWKVRERIKCMYFTQVHYSHREYVWCVHSILGNIRNLQYFLFPTSNLCVIHSKYMFLYSNWKLERRIFCQAVALDV